MDQYIIKGGNPLVGEVEIGGAKNAALGILAAAIMTDETVVIDNLPDVQDINVLLETCLAGSIITVLPLDLRLFYFRIIVDPLPDLIESAALHEGFFHVFHLLTGKIPASDLFKPDSFHLRHNDPRVGQQVEITDIFIAEVTHGSLNLLLHAALISLI